MSDQSQSTLSKVAPWRKGAAWWLVLGEGLILLALGIFFLISPLQALTIFGILFAAYLAISGAIQLYASLRVEDESAARMPLLIRGAIGLVAGLLILVLRLTDVLTLDLGMWILIISLLAYSLLGLYGTYVGREQGGIRWGLVLNSTILLFVAVVLLYAQSTQAGLLRNTLQWLAIISLVGGALLALYGFMLYRANKSANP